VGLKMIHISRREAFYLLLGGLLPKASPISAADAPLKLLLVHGRGQGGQSADELKKQWLDTLSEGVAKSGHALPKSLDVAFPFYGDTLDRFAAQANLPLSDDIRGRGVAPNNEFLAFQAELAQSIRRGAGITDDQIAVEYGDNPKPRGPLNWEWVHAILRAIDKYGGGLSQGSVETFTRDVFLYTTRSGVRDAIDDLVKQQLTDQPTVVIAHSLGSIVAYNVLRADPRPLRVPLLLTVGCPLGIRAVRDQLLPLKFPKPVHRWYNAFDKRDVVALFPLDNDNFPVVPEIVNYADVNNQTDNRHGIVGYLNDRQIGEEVSRSL
jgi:hypothetical protein